MTEQWGSSSLESKLQGNGTQIRPLRLLDPLCDPGQVTQYPWTLESPSTTWDHPSPSPQEN